MKTYQLLTSLGVVSALLFSSPKQANACHAIALINFNQQDTSNPNQIMVTAASDNPTCGCDEYWLDLEVRCINEPFDAAPFNPGFWGPLSTYPYFQSAQMLKPQCQVVTYPWITIPYAGLCPGMTYQYRMRENHNGQVGPWCAVQQFTVPGATQPIVAGATANTTTICAGDCVNLSSSVVQGCGLAASYNWDNGVGAGQNQTVCPNVTTTYTVTIDEQCSGFQDQASVTINVVPPPVVGTASISHTSICAGTSITVDLVGQQGTVQWQSAPGGAGPWSNIPGATGNSYIDPGPVANTCYRAEITGCAPPPAGVQQLYSNVVCVAVDPIPTANFTYVPACPGSPIQFTNTSNGNGTAITAWAWDFNGDGIVDDNTQNPNSILPGIGPWNVTLTVTNGTGCNHTVTLPVNPAAGATADFVAAPACPGTPTSFTDMSVAGGGANVTAWAWDFDGDGNIDNTNQNPNHSFNTSGIHNVSLMITASSGCVHTIVLPITIPDLPLASFIMQNVCDGVMGNFNDASSINGTATITNWAWDMQSDNTVDYTTQNASHMYPGNNNYNVTLTVTASNGCVDDTMQVIQVYPNPVANFTTTTVCAGAATDFIDLCNANGGTISALDWDVDNDGNVDYTTTGNGAHTYATSGNYMANLTATTSNGCSHNIILPVNVEPQPTANFTFVNACDGQNVNFTDASNPNGGTINQWDWDFNGDGITDNSTQNPSNVFPTENVYNVQLTVTSAAGCTDVINHNIEVWPNPVANFTPQSVCLDVPVNFADISTVSNANTANTITAWSWDVDGDGVMDYIGTPTPPTQTYTVPGTYNISLTVTTNNGCSDNLAVPIDIYDQPVADFTFVDDCVNNHAGFTDVSTVLGGTVNTWDWDVDGDGITDYTNQNPTHQYTSAGTYNVTLISTSSYGCADTVLHQITRHPMPVAIFNAGDECVYDSICYTDMSVVGAPDNVTNHIWTFGDGSPLDANQNPCHQFANAGTYTTCLIVTSNNGCIDDTCMNVTVHPEPNVSFTANSICENEPPTTFVNTSTISTGSINQWNWTFEPGAVSNLQDPTYQYGMAGTYNPILIGISDFGCSDTASATVDVLAAPVAVIGSDLTEGCPDFCIQFDASASISNAGSMATWQWDLGNGATSNVSNPNNCYANSGLLSDVYYSVQLIVSNNLGCSDTVFMNDYVTVHPNPMADFTATPTTVNEFDANITFDNLSVGADSYYWDFDDSLNSTDIHPVHLFNDTGFYDVWLYAYTAYGCVDSISEQIEVVPVPSVFIPNAFTPDSDGINDGFAPVLYGWNDGFYEFIIFDRWGQTVFISHHPGESWDGSINGSMVDSKTDVYGWKLVLGSYQSSKKEEYVGHVTLVR